VRNSSETSTTAIDPRSGIVSYELSHVWGHGAPAHPGFPGVQIRRQANHAEHGVTSQRIRTVMHTGTHVNAPRHLVQGGAAIADLPLQTFFGPGVVVGAAKERWETVGVADLKRAAIEPGDIVVIATGWHRFYGDSQRYFAEAPGLDPAAAAWLVALGVKLVAVDTPNVDHPLATSLGGHRGGPTARYLPARYEREVGRPAAADFPDWNPAHRLLLEAGVPTIENVGGAVEELCGRRVTIEAFPWRWPEGDACQVRMVALVDPAGEYRIETGER
jgi:kynurenine formamidase